MISKFFIERPILANVIAILIVVIGAVAVFALPVAQYPDVVPPTVQVTTRYPGASARTVIDTVALPIEQQVNGVEGMIYMQSYAAADGSYSLTVTFKIGTDLNFAQVLVQNRVQAALSSLPHAVQSQGVVVQKKSTSILQIVTLTSPSKRYDSLYLANYATINLKDELSRLPGVGNVVVFGAGQYAMRVWLDPEKMKARSLNVQDVINALQQQNEQVTAGQIGAPPAPNDVPFQYTLNVAGRLDTVGTVRQRHRQDRLQRPDHARARHRPCRARRADLRPDVHARRQAGGGPRHLPVAGRQRAQRRERSQEAHDGAGARLSARARLRHSFRHHGVREGFDRRSLQDAVRGGDPGADRHPGVPAGLARHAGAGDHGAGHHHRRLRRHGGARLHGQLRHAVRHRAGDRHRGRRRHHRGGGRGPQYRQGHERPRGGDRRHAGAVRADHRHHAGAAGGVPAGGLPARPDRPDVRAIRAGDRGDRADQRGQCGDAEADAVRAVAAADGADGKAQLASTAASTPPIPRSSAAMPR